MGTTPVKAGVLMLAALFVGVSGCKLSGPDSDPEPDPEQNKCESRGGDYLCTGIGPDGLPICTCVLSAA